MNKWTVREKVIRGSSIDSNIVMQELYYEGRLVHQLHGPTARKSLLDIAEQYNKKRRKPRAAGPRVVADGWRQPQDSYKIK